VCKLIKEENNSMSLFTEAINLEESENEQVETLTIMIPIALKKKLKIKAIHNNSTVTKIILNYIRGYVDE
jgi:hypothetical protein